MLLEMGAPRSCRYAQPKSQQIGMSTLLGFPKGNIIIDDKKWRLQQPLWPLCGWGVMQIDYTRTFGPSRLSYAIENTKDIHTVDQSLSSTPRGFKGRRGLDKTESIGLLASLARYISPASQTNGNSRLLLNRHRLYHSHLFVTRMFCVRVMWASKSGIRSSACEARMPRTLCRRL